MSAEALTVALDVSAIPAAPAGAGRYVVELVGALARRGDVALVALTRRDDATRWRVGEGVRVLAAAPNPRPARLLWGEFALGRALDASIAVLHGPHYTLPRRARGAGRVVTVHDVTLLEHPEWHERSKVAILGRALRQVRERADVVVVPSRFVAERYAECLGTDLPVRVVPHGVDHDRFGPDETVAGRDDAVLAAAGIHWPYVFFVGTNEPRKNLPSLVRAFGKLASGRPELHLVLAGGPGWRPAPLEEAIATSRVADRIHRLGYVGSEDVPSLLRRAAAVAYPSFEEGFGLPALEALACGAPLVTTAHSAMAEVTGDAALLVAAGDDDALAEAIEALVDGGAARAVRRAAGIERAARYTWAASAESHLGAYREAARR